MLLVILFVIVTLLLTVLFVAGGVSSFKTSIVNVLEVITELLLARFIKLSVIVYCPASVKVAFIGVVLVKSPWTANPAAGPQ